MDQKMNRRRLLGTSAALAAAAPLATLRFANDVTAAPAVDSAPAITLADLPGDASEGHWAGCPWPIDSEGVPYIWGVESWTDTDEPRPIMLRIAEQAVDRLDSPLNAMIYDVLEAMKGIAKTHLPADVYSEYYDLHSLFDMLHIPYREFVLDVCARVLPHVDVRDGDLEGILQAAFRRGGIPNVTAADALIQSVFVDCPMLLDTVRDSFPNFDPTRLSMLTPHVGCSDRRGDAWSL